VASQALLNYGFSFFESRKLYDAQYAHRHGPHLERQGKRIAVGRGSSLVRDRAQGASAAGQHHHHRTAQNRRAGAERISPSAKSWSSWAIRK
jgi:hypothetical protein